MNSFFVIRCIDTSRLSYHLIYPTHPVLCRHFSHIPALPRYFCIEFKKIIRSGQKYKLRGQYKIVVLDDNVNWSSHRDSKS